MTKLKMFIETTGNERVVQLHFNCLVSNFISRIATPMEVEQGYNDSPVKMFGGPPKLPEFIPHSGIIGVEQLLKTSAYSIIIFIGKCFKFTDVINSIVDCLEMDFTSEEYSEWLYEVKKSYPNVDSLFSTNNILELTSTPNTTSTPSELPKIIKSKLNKLPTNKYGV